MSTNTYHEERRALSIKEAAQACGLSRATLYRLIAEGKLRTLKVGARRLVPTRAIDALLNFDAPAEARAGDVQVNARRPRDA